VPLLPTKRREQFQRGVGGGDPLHRLQARQQGRQSRSLRGASGQFSLAVEVHILLCWLAGGSLGSPVFACDWPLRR
jgi:hypothetical protein